MKALVVADLEGAAGVRNPRECFPNFEEYQAFGLPNMTADALAAAEGLKAGGADEVVLVDGHFLGNNLLSSGLPDGVRLSKGSLLDELKRGDLGGAFLTGIHGKTGTPNSFSSSTFAPFVAARLDGDIIGDTLFLAYLCGSQGVPLLGLSGDWVACEEVQWTLPRVPTAPTKTGFDRASVRHHAPLEARKTLREVAERAAKTPPVPLKARLPFRLELSFFEMSDAEAAEAACRGLAQRSGRVLVHTGSLFEEAAEFAARAVGALYPGWVDGIGRRAVPEQPSGRTAGGLIEAALFERFYGPSAPYWSL